MLGREPFKLFEVEDRDIPGDGGSDGLGERKTFGEPPFAGELLACGTANVAVVAVSRSADAIECLNASGCLGGTCGSLGGVETTFRRTGSLAVARTGGPCSALCDDAAD